MICEQKLHQSKSSREESKVCYMLFCIAIYYYKSLQFEGFGNTSRKDILSKAVKSGRFISYCAWLYYFVLFLKVKSWNVTHRMRFASPR